MTVGPLTLEAFQPLAKSIEWQLGLRYLAQRGHAAFLGDLVPVPYAINNDVNMSTRAAGLLFASLTENQPADPDVPIIVLELGVGLGLFARYFLDHFRTICREQNRDWYGRLTYVLGDYSEQMLLDVARRGVLSDHPGRTVLRVVNALEPDVLASDPVLDLTVSGGLRAVHLNYLLDCLPATVVRSPQHGTLEELHVTTRLARNAPLEHYTDLSPDDLTLLTQSPAGQDQLVELFPVFAAEYRYVPVKPADAAYPEFAAAEAQRHSPSAFLHSYGAIQSIERLLAMLHPTGHILANDYGYADDRNADEFMHQRYTGTTFVPVNFSLIERYFRDVFMVQVCTPHAEEGSLLSRLIGRQVPETVVTRFRDLFDKGHAEWLNTPAARARQAAQAMYQESALTYYQAALARQPANWLIAIEVVNFLNFGLREPQEALKLAHQALRTNPTCSADLWNAAGDCYFSMGRIGESRHCFERAVHINPADVAGHYNLAWVYQHYRDYPAALSSLATALSLDRTGQWRERLLQKQAEVLSTQDRKQRYEMLATANRVKPPTPVATAPPKAVAPVDTTTPKPPSTDSSPPPSQMQS